MLMKNIVRNAASCGLLFSLILTGCSGDDPSQPLDRVASLDLSPEAVSVVRGDTLRLSLLALGSSGAPVQDVRAQWTSSDAAVASVDSTGLVTAADTGRATISASVGSLSAQAEVVVGSGDGGLRVVPEDAVMQVGWQFRFEARLAGGAESPAVRWRVSNPAVLRAHENGFIEALETGSALVIAELVSDPSVRGTASVTVQANTGAPGAILAIESADDGRALDPMALTGTVVVRVASGDPAQAEPERVELLLDDEVIASAPYAGGQATHELTWNTTSHANGPYTLRRRTVRADGHVISITSPLQIRIDN